METQFKNNFQTMLFNSHSSKSSRGLSHGKRTDGTSRVSSRGSSGSGSTSLSSRTAVLGSRDNSLNSSPSVLGFRKRHSHLQARVNSAKRKSQYELINSIASLKIQTQDLNEENRNLKRLLARQEKELNKYIKTESDLPVILRAHNEESRVLKMKLKQVQDNNKKLGQNVKSKDFQISTLVEENKVLKKINSMEKRDEVYVLQEKINEVSSHLQSRDNEYKVISMISFFSLFHDQCLGIVKETGYS